MLPIANRQALQADPALHNYTFEIVEQLRQHDITTEPIGAGPLDLTPRLHTSAHDQTQWTITTVEDDPLVRRSQLVIPKQQLQNLRRINQTGIEFDQLFIAHELPPRSLPTQRPGWRTLDDFDLHYLHQHSKPPPNQQALQHAERIGNAIEYTARAALSTTRRGNDSHSRRLGTTALTAAALTTALSTLATLDPIIIATTTHQPHPRPGDPVAYLVIARWDW